MKEEMKQRLAEEAATAAEEESGDEGEEGDDDVFVLADEGRDALGDESPRKSRKAVAGGGGRRKKGTSEVIIRESLARNYSFFGDEGMKKIRNSFVVIVGLGGVGVSFRFLKKLVCRGNES